MHFSGSLASMASVLNFTTCKSLNNQPCLIIPTLSDLSPNEYNLGLCYYPFVVNLARCNGNCNTFDGPFGRICVSNKLENVNIIFFNTLVGINV